MRERWASLAAIRLALSGYLGQGGRQNCLALFKNSALPAERGEGKGEAEVEVGGETDLAQYCVIVLIGGIEYICTVCHI